MPTAKKEKAPPGPDDLVRESAGVYRTGDGRFEVQKSDLGWYLVDTEHANEFGQQLIHGPLTTLAAIRDAIPGARDLKPLLRVRPRKTPHPPTSTRLHAEPAPPPPPTWLDQLPDKEAAQLRRLISALENEGLPDSEQLVKRQRGDTTPLIATRLIEYRLRRLVEESPGEQRAVVRRVMRSVIDELTNAGAAVPRPLPRWALVELGDDDPLPSNRIRPHP